MTITALHASPLPADITATPPAPFTPPAPVPDPDTFTAASGNETDKAFVSHLRIENPHLIRPRFDVTGTLYPPVFVQLADKDGNRTILVLEHHEPDIDKAQQAGWLVEDMRPYMHDPLVHAFFVARDLSGAVLGYKAVGIDPLRYLFFARAFRPDENLRTKAIKGINMALTAYAFQCLGPLLPDFGLEENVAVGINPGLLPSFRRRYFGKARSPASGLAFGRASGTESITRREADFIRTLFAFTPVPTANRKAFNPGKFAIARVTTPVVRIQVPMAARVLMKAGRVLSTSC